MSDQQHLTGQTMQMLESRSAKKWGLGCAKFGRNAFSSMTTRRNFTDRDITELITASDSDAHSSEVEDISGQNDSDRR